MSQHALSRRVGAGFTLVELLVVIGIISALAAILMPSLEQSLASARSVYCMNNLKQIGVSTHLYTNDNRGWTIPSSIYFTMKDTGTDHFREFFYLLAYLNYLPHERYSTESPHGIRFMTSTVSDTSGDYPFTYGRYYKPYNPMHFCPLSRSFSGGELSQAGQISEFMYGSRHDGYYNLDSSPVLYRNTGNIISERIRDIGPIKSTGLPQSKFIMWGDTCIWYKSLCYASFGIQEGTMSVSFPYVSQTSAYEEFHMRHNKSGNAWFADGHVGSVNYDTIVNEKLNILATYGPD